MVSHICAKHYEDEQCCANYYPTFVQNYMCGASIQFHSPSLSLLPPPSPLLPPSPPSLHVSQPPRLPPPPTKADIKAKEKQPKKKKPAAPKPPPPESPPAIIHAEEDVPPAYTPAVNVLSKQFQTLRFGLVASFPD